MVTLSDVAKKANVSKMTVSRAINHPEKVTKELKELVYVAMKELNYKPNLAAKALANNRTQIIKVFILEEMDTTEPYYMNLLTGIANKLDEEYYSLQLVTRKNVNIGHSDGYIVCGARESDYETINNLEKPVVLFGENKHSFDYVDTKNQEGIGIATEYALSLRYEHIVYIGIDVDEPFEMSRELGYRKAMSAALKKEYLYRFENRSRYTGRFIEENWSGFEKNTCFVCSSDRLAIGILRGIREKEGKVPEEFGIIGHDGVFLDQIAYPQLTTMKQSVMDMGALCAAMVLKKVRENGKPQGNILCDSQLIVRGTTR
ncbi:LacI family DNA-binding transcriptional regulator [Lacticigenium naphthae]|uniref:LacI family DNA-binding transcriptional regulator n=1 Tax=Lacticigenium naphthae TaxID=515351 RepID=UPI0004183489|nr:LacI family DNA-binding transcriptional regulator [Lacticigenium naphthae]